MPGENLASVIDAAVSDTLERLEAKRVGNVKKPRKDLQDADTAPGVRAISAPVAAVRLGLAHDRPLVVLEKAQGIGIFRIMSCNRGKPVLS